MLVKEVVGVCDGLTGGSQDRMIRSEFVMLASVIFAQTHRINDLCCSVVYIGFINLAPFHEVIGIVCPIIIERRQKKIALVHCCYAPMVQTFYTETREKNLI